MSQGICGFRKRRNGGRHENGVQKLIQSYLKDLISMKYPPSLQRAKLLDLLRDLPGPNQQPSIAFSHPVVTESGEINVFQ